MDVIQLIYAISLVPFLRLDSSFSRSEATLTKAEKDMGLAIIDKLDSMMGWTGTPGIAFVPIRGAIKSEVASASGGSSGSAGSGGSRYQISQSAVTGTSGSFRHNMDCIIVLDNSGSIGLTEFNQAKESAKKIVKFIDTASPIKPMGSRIGLVEFSTLEQTHMVFGLTSGNNYELEVEYAIDNIGYDSGRYTATVRALQVAKTEFQRHNSNYRARAVWILTDGQSNHGGNPVAAAQQLKDMGVQVCALAVGSNVNMNEINAMGSHDCTFRASTFGTLSKSLSYAISARVHLSSNPTVPPNFFSGLSFGKRFLQLLKRRYDNSDKLE